MTEPIINDFELVVNETNALAVSDNDRDALVATLKPIAEKIANAMIFADQIKVTNEQEAKDAAVSRDVLIEYADTAEKALRNFDNRLVERLHKAHRGWTSLIGRFAVLNEAARKIKQAILSWQAAEEEKAERERQRLQAEADERARQELERLRKQAEKLKTPELKEQRLEQAAAVTAPVIHVAAPTKAVAGQKRWKVKAFDLTAMGVPAAVQGYVEVKVSNLERAKAANSLLTVPGVEFHQVLV